MTAHFNIENPPFDLLTEDERVYLRKHVDIQYFKEGEDIIRSGGGAEFLYVILKGIVAESDDSSTKYEDGEVFAHYGNDDIFDAHTLLTGQAIHRFFAEEETICYLIPKDVFFDLLKDNPPFSAYFQQGLAAKADILARRDNDQHLAAFMLAQAGGQTLREPPVLDGETTILEATRTMREVPADCLFVRDGQRTGLITGTNLLDAVVLDRKAVDDPIRDVATYDLISVESGDFLFNALILMTRHHIERVVVTHDGDVIGLVDLTDILSYFSTHSHVIALRIERAKTVEQLIQASTGIADLIRSTLSHGVKTHFIMDLLSALNIRIITRLFFLIIPDRFLSDICLLVMGSEGRGEQILKTDQDNALVLRDGMDRAELMPHLEAFSKAMEKLGYPPCPGNVMVSNPEWVLTQSEWREQLSDWAYSRAPQNLMNLAIFFDSAGFAGNRILFKQIKEFAHQMIHANDLFLHDFARPVLQFSLPLTFFGSLRRSKQGLDIKKSGIFPIVHGVRSLALQHRLAETGTFARIDSLVKLGTLREDLGNDLKEAFRLFSTLRLRAQLRKKDAGEPIDNIINTEKMPRQERDYLRDSMRIVKDFRTFLTQHFHLDVA